MLFSKKKRRKSKTKTKAARKKRVKKKAGKRVTKARIRKKKRVIKKTPKGAKKKEVQIGRVTHYFPHVKAGAILIESGTIAMGDAIHIKGHTTDFKQKIKSLQINRVSIKEASEGDEVGILVKSRVRINDKVYEIKS